MKRTKILVLLLAIGLAGVIAATGIALGTGHIRPYAETKSYPIEHMERVELSLHCAEVTAVPVTEDYRAEVYVNAWLPRPPEFDRVVSVNVADGTLTITETPFPNEFLGMFPQPYEMKLTLYLPAAACERIEEVRK
ncbi:MAG TPA: hypothetical protein VN366_10935 [Feifaniaceae bacterium]|nr:hypothetical protein [Feifaniaceae bacterium]